VSLIGLRDARLATIKEPDMPLFTPDELAVATTTVRAFVPPTPAYAWPLLAKRIGAEVIVKHENHTPTGSFKVRGGLVYVDDACDASSPYRRLSSEKVVGRSKWGDVSHPSRRPCPARLALALDAVH
jgi:hypothetical protein